MKNKSKLVKTKYRFVLFTGFILCVLVVACFKNLFAVERKTCAGTSIAWRISVRDKKLYRNVLKKIQRIEGLSCFCFWK